MKRNLPLYPHPPILRRKDYRRTYSMQDRRIQARKYTYPGSNYQAYVRTE